MSEMNILGEVVNKWMIIKWKSKKRTKMLMQLIHTNYRLKR